MKPRFFAAFALLLASQLTATHGAYGYPSVPSVVGVELEDLKTHHPELLPQATALLRSIRRRGHSLYGLRSGDEVIRRALTAEPVLTDTGITFNLELLVVTSVQGRYFKRYTVTIPNDRTQVSHVEPLSSLSLRRVRAKIRVGLVQRKAIVEDVANGIKMIFPLGVGAIDRGVSPASHGVTTLMTPTFTNAHLVRRRSVARASKPAYFKDLPYMPIVREDGRVTPIAFHIIQHPRMVRGFDSHGCMRLREDDLQILYTLLSRGGSARIPIDVLTTLPDLEDHPYPLRDDGYQELVNCAAPGEAPRMCPDPEHPDLNWTKDIEGIPPLDEILGTDGNNMTREEFASDPLGEFLDGITDDDQIGV